MDERNIVYSLSDNIKSKKELYLSPKISDELIVESITNGNIKSHDKYVQELNHKRTTSYEINFKHAKDVHNLILHFNKMSFFHDVKQWLKNAKK